MIRLLIIVVAYSLTVFVLPRWSRFSDLSQSLAQLTSQTAFIINISALIAASGCLYVMTRPQKHRGFNHVPEIWGILQTGLVGVIFATLYALAEAMSGYAITITNLLIIPLAFLVGETTYTIARKLWMQLPQNRHLQKTTSPEKTTLHETDRMPAGSEDEEQTPKGPPRLLITLPVYVLILVYLPQQQDFRNLEAKLVNIDPALSFALSIAALILAAMIAGISIRQARSALVQPDQTPVMTQKSIHFNRIKLSICLTFCLGLAIAALINATGYLVGYAPSLSMLIIMPLGFTVAEVLYSMISWRVIYGPPGH